MEDIWTSSPYDAALIRFYTNKEAHTKSQFGSESQFDLWPKELPNSGIFVQGEGSFFSLPGYSLSNSQSISAYIDDEKPGTFIQTHIWKTVIFTKNP